MEPQIIAVAKDYEALIAALREWAWRLETTHAAIDDLAGLPEGYTNKCIRPEPDRGLNKTSLGLMLGALGLELWVVVDPVQLELVRHRLPSSRWPAKRRARSHDTGGTHAVGLGAAVLK